MENNSSFITKVYLFALFPNIVAILGGTINVFFDAVFVGQKLGALGLESVNQSLPAYLFLCTIGSLFAAGASFLSSIALGKNDQKEAVRLFQASLGCAAVVGAFFCVLGLVLSEPLARLLASEASYDYVLVYLRITLAGGLFKILLYIPYFYLRLEGKNRRSAIAMFTMTVLNIVLDYLFLFHLDLGIAGAAWASVIATAVACIMSFVFLFTDHSNFHFGLARMRRKDWAEVVQYGSPMALNNILSSARILAVNLLLGRMGIPAMASIFAVVNNLNEFSICIQNGVPQTASAMTAIFFGEKDSDSIKRTLNVQLVSGGALSIAFAALLALGADHAGRLFGSEVDCSFAVLCFAASLLFATFNSTLSYYCNAIGRIRLANLITISRGFAAVALFCWLLLPLNYKVWIFYPAAEIFTALVFLVAGAVLCLRERLTPFYLLDERLERDGQSISFTVDCSPEMICGASDQIRAFCEKNAFSPKETMAISLSIEEILTIIAQKSLLGKGSMSVRVLRYGQNGIVRIRSAGRRYNPIEERDGSLDYMGVDMICNLSHKIEYHSSLGINTLMIFV